MDAAPVMVYGEDVTHVVTEQGIAYLYQAQSAEERTKMLGCIAQGTPVGSMVGIGEIEQLRREGKVAYPQDLAISPDAAKRELLAANSLEEIADLSGGLYRVPEQFRKQSE